MQKINSKGELVDMTQDEIAEITESREITVEQEREQASVSRDYLLIKANEFGWFTEAECVAWIGGTLPQDVSALIDTFPENERFKLRLSALRQETVPRETPLILAIMNLRGVTEDQMDSVYGINITEPEGLN
jgi:hypothetical protein